MKRRKNNKSFIVSLLNKEKLTEEDFIKLDKIWKQFIEWKNNNGGLLNIENKQVNIYDGNIHKLNLAGYERYRAYDRGIHEYKYYYNDLW